MALNYVWNGSTWERLVPATTTELTHDATDPTWSTVVGGVGMLRASAAAPTPVGADDEPVAPWGNRFGATAVFLTGTSNAVVPGTWFSRMVLSAPMIAIAEKRLGVSPPIARVAAEVLAGFGADSLYVWGGSQRPIELGPYDDNPLTTDRDRYARNAAVLEAAPRLGLGSPTNGWLRAALRSCARLGRPDYPLRVQVPLLLFAAGMDTIVSTTAIEEFAVRLKVGTHVLLPQARHEILQETDAVRRDFWAAFDAYLGVNAAAA